MAVPLPDATFYCVTFNLKGFAAMVQRWVNADIQRVKTLGGLIFWQEAGWHERYVGAIKRLMPSTDAEPGFDWAHVFFPGNSTGISYDRDQWRPDGRPRKVLLHAAVPGVCDARYMVVLVLRHLVSGHRFTLICFHHAPRARGKGLAAQRAGNASILREMRASLAKGVPVLAAGDANQTGRFLGEQLDGRRVSYVSGDKGGGIDKFVFVAPQRHSWLLPAAERRVFGGFHSDHDAVRTRPTYRKDAPVRFVTRAQWGASPQRATPQSHPIGATKGITVHWEGPHMGKFPHESCAQKVRDIERYHEQTKGWADLAYNGVVCPHGYVFEGRGPGVQSAANGETDTNDDWYAVCYLGGVDDGFTEAGKQGFLDAFDWLTRLGGAGPLRNGHRDHKPTACPGFEIYRWVSALPDGATSSTPTPSTGKDWFDMATQKELEAAVAKVIWGIQIPAPPGSKAERAYGAGAKLSLPNAIYWSLAEGTDDANEATLKKVAAEITAIKADLADDGR